MPWLLLAGAALGLALSAWGLLEDSGERHVLSAETAAVVGDRVIRRVDYERMLAGVEQDRRGPIDDTTRRRVLERMIDEELLVQKALALGLAAADRRVRGELVSGLVDSVVSEADADAPTAAEIEEHFQGSAAFFARPGRLRVETLFFSPRSDGSARARADSARARLMAGEDSDGVEQELADRQLAEAPDALLPLAKLRDYLGPTLAEALASLEVGNWSKPIEAGEGIWLVRIREHEAQTTPPLAEVEPLVRQDLIRRRGDEALGRYLDSLREEIHVERNKTVFPPEP